MELKNEIGKFNRWLIQKRFSKNTVKTYTNSVKFYLAYCIAKSLEFSAVRSIELFNYEFIVVKNKSISYQNQCINGIKKYLEYKSIPIASLQIQRPSKEKKLPEVLSLSEIKEPVTKH